MYTVRKIVVLLILVVGAIALPACGEAQKTSKSLPFVETHKTDLALPDCSGSFRETSVALAPEMAKVAQNSAQHRRALWAGCFDGAPMRTLVWNPTLNFGDIPSAIEANDGLVKRFNQARALAFGRQLEKVVRSTHVEAPGSGILEALELASQTENVGRVFMFTDADINEVDGLRLDTATSEQIGRTVKRWAPRLGKGLRHVELTFIGVGRNVRSTGIVRNAKTLFAGLAKAVGAGAFHWYQKLPADFGKERR